MLLTQLAHLPSISDADLVDQLQWVHQSLTAADDPTPHRMHSMHLVRLCIHLVALLAGHPQHTRGSPQQEAEGILL